MLSKTRQRFSSIIRTSTTLTSQRFPSIQRRTDFAKLEEKDFTVFERLVGDSNVLRTDLDAYNEDWLGIFRGASSLVLRPKNTQQISEIMRHCNQRRLAVCIQSGNTGLVGGGVPIHDEIVLNMSHLTGDIAFEADTGILTSPAGNTLQALDEEISEHGFTMPLDLGAKGSCMIGGNIATAAGGIRFVRYGSLHAHVLKLKVVKADGTILELGNAVRKDNTGLHLAHLFVGSEGQLGIITEVTMTTVPKPTTVPTYNNCLSILREARKHLGEIMSAFEFIDQGSMDCCLTTSGLKCPLDSPSPFYLLIETHGSNKDHDDEKMQSFLEKCMEKELCTDGTPASNEQQAAHMWAIRERMAEGLRADGHTYKQAILQDISLPLTHYYALNEHVKERVGHLATRVVTYGHLADGNAHLNITSKEYNEEIQTLLYPHLYEWVSSRGGSISAEHGIGFAKQPYIGYSQTSEAVEMMRVLKTAFDPRGLLNPYKTIPM